MPEAGGLVGEAGVGAVRPADGQAVGDVAGGAGGDALGGPPADAGRLEDPGLARIGEEEAILVAPVVTFRARAALAVGLKQGGGDGDGLGGGGGALEDEADEVHAEEASGAVIALAGEAGADCLVARAEPTLVGTHLCTPEPRRSAKNDSIRCLGLWDLDVLATKHATSWGMRPREADDFVHLVGWTVGVLTKYGLGSSIADNNKGIAGARVGSF